MTPPGLLTPDTNEFHPIVDPAALAAWTPSIILRVCYGTTHVDNVYPANRAAVDAEPAFRAIGLYCYVVATEDAAAQGTFFAQQVLAHGGFTPGRHWIAADVEEGQGDQSARAQAFMAAAHAVLHDPAGDEFDYSGAYFFATQLAGVVGVHRWIAAYGQPTAPPSATLWQFTSTQIVPGISGPCDCSTFAGTIDQFLELIAPPPAPPAPQEDPDMPVVVQVGADGTPGSGFWLFGLGPPIGLSDQAEVTEALSVAKQISVPVVSQGFLQRVQAAWSTVQGPAGAPGPQGPPGPAGQTSGTFTGTIAGTVS